MLWEIIRVNIASHQSLNQYTLCIWISKAILNDFEIDVRVLVIINGQFKTMSKNYLSYSNEKKF